MNNFGNAVASGKGFAIDWRNADAADVLAAVRHRIDTGDVPRKVASGLLVALCDAVMHGLDLRHLDSES